MQEKHICAECVYWESGPFWSSGSGKHGTLVEAKGWCNVKKNRRKRWNYHPACELCDLMEKTSFTYCGGGGTPIEEDLQNITAQLNKIMDNNKNTESEKQQ